MRLSSSFVSLVLYFSFAASAATLDVDETTSHNDLQLSEVPGMTLILP